MRTKRENMTNPVEQVVVGLFSKKEAAKRVAEGCRHIHSSILGQKDSGYQNTRKCLETGKDLTYSWELKREATEMRIDSSASRHQCIEKIIGDTGTGTKRHLKEKLSSVLEELVTNALYHAYRTTRGNEKYARNKAAHLSAQERIAICYRATESGIYLAVRDQGGSLSFEDVARSFQRCYSGHSQIENKEGGAGLGMYMIFEYCSHLKISCHPGKQSELACWLADKKSFDPDTFSFNFFQWR
jgi:anti-sigma regulatory factor (Ser/Thr protein kinase)